MISISFLNRQINNFKFPKQSEKDNYKEIAKNKSIKNVSYFQCILYFRPYRQLPQPLHPTFILQATAKQPDNQGERRKRLLNYNHFFSSNFNHLFMEDFIQKDQGKGKIYQPLYYPYLPDRNPTHVYNNIHSSFHFFILVVLGVFVCVCVFLGMCGRKKDCQNEFQKCVDDYYKSTFPTIS